MAARKTATTKTKVKRSTVAKAKAPTNTKGRRKIAPIPQWGSEAAALLIKRTLEASELAGNEFAREITARFKLIEQGVSAFSGVTVASLLKPANQTQGPNRWTLYYVSAYIPSYPDRAERLPMKPSVLRGWFDAFDECNPDTLEEWKGWRDWLNTPEFYEICEELRVKREAEVVGNVFKGDAMLRLSNAVEYTQSITGQTIDELCDRSSLPREAFEKLVSGSHPNPEGALALLARHLVADDHGTPKTFTGGSELYAFLTE